LTPEQTASLASAQRVNPEAYDAYLQGRSINDGTFRGITKAQKYFEEAIQKQPDFALGYVGLADCYSLLGSFRLVPPQDAYSRSKEIILKALQIDDTLAEAHDTLGDLSWHYDWDWGTAEKEYRYALKRNPNYIAGHQSRAWYLGWLGRSDEALAEVAKIRELDPANPFTFLDDAGIYYHSRDYPALLEVSRKSVALNPDNWVGHYFLAVAYDDLSRPLQAVPEYQKAVELSQGDTDAVSGLAHAFAGAAGDGCPYRDRQLGSCGMISSAKLSTVMVGRLLEPIRANLGAM
jgi:tetratricopeptide (TPR) repeat protein